MMIICSVTLLNSCGKEDIDPSGQSTSPNLSTRGGLAFKVVDGAGSPIEGVTLRIALSQTDMATGTYLATRYTDDNGRADFGLLNAGNYYYRADYTLNDVTYHGEGVVQVQSGENLTQELTLR